MGSLPILIDNEIFYNHLRFRLMKIISYLTYLSIFLNLSCKSGYTYESESYKGKSYLSKFESTIILLDDSISIQGIIFSKKKHSLSTVPSVKIILIDKNNDTVINTRSHFYGFEFLIIPGKYKLIINHPKQMDIEVDSLLFEMGKKYEMDTYLQKGKGNTKWYVN